MMTPFSARCEQMSCQGQTLMDGSRSLRRAETAVTKRHQRCNEPPRSPWPRRAARRYKPGMNHEQILCRREGSVATIVLNRPEKLNAFTFRMLAEIHAALDTLPFDDLRALVFTGAGRAFSAGDDLIDMGGTDPAEDIRRGHHRLVTRLRGARVPVIAALHGYTLGAAFVDRLLALPAGALGAQKACVEYGRSHGLAESLEYEMTELIHGFGREEWGEAIRAFAEKRPPRWR